MKRVKSELTGGFPFTLDEITYIQENIKELTSGLAKGLSSENITVKLYGIDVTINGSGGATPIADITAGLFWYLDELYFYDATSINLPSGYTLTSFNDNYYFDLSETDDTSVTFNDSLSKDIHEVRKTILTLTPTTWVGLNYGNTASVVENILLLFPSASTSIEGKVQLATNSETSIGSDSTKVVTPAGLKYVVKNSGELAITTSFSSTITINYSNQVQINDLTTIQTEFDMSIGSTETGFEISTNIGSTESVGQILNAILDDVPTICRVSGVTPITFAFSESISAGSHTISIWGNIIKG